MHVIINVEQGSANPNVSTLLRLSDALGIRLQVRGGTVTVEVADQSEVLGVGDAMSFAGDVPHSYANENTEPVRFCLTVLEPGVGAATASEASHD